ncbi:MAG TPA: hypothetical protein PKK23_21110, partial [Nitrospirales bacterium]|nr:hypothetical protein [Nitrospirales bacterium]
PVGTLLIPRPLAAGIIYFSNTSQPNSQITGLSTAFAIWFLWKYPDHKDTVQGFNGKGLFWRVGPGPSDPNACSAQVVYGRKVVVFV